MTPRAGVVQIDFDTTANGQVEGILLVDGVPARFGVLTLDDNKGSGWVGETGRVWLQKITAGTYLGVWTNGQSEKRCKIIVSEKPLVISEAICK